MTADQLHALGRIVASRNWQDVENNHALLPIRDVALLLTLLEGVARTAASHFDPESFYQDGEIDAIAILSTLEGKLRV